MRHPRHIAWYGVWGEEFRDRSFDRTPRRIGPDGRAHTEHEFWNLFGTHTDLFGFVPDLWRDAQELIVYLPIGEAPCFRETGPNVQPEDMRWAFQHESDYRRWVANGRWLTLAGRMVVFSPKWVRFLSNTVLPCISMY